MGAQILGAPYIKKFKIEPISMGYVIVGDGGTVGKVGKAIPVPYNNPELAVAHALAGQYLGMRFIYLEGGSGVKVPVPAEMIRAVKQAIDIPLIVGGGIRNQRSRHNSSPSRRRRHRHRQPHRNHRRHRTSITNNKSHQA